MKFLKLSFLTLCATFPLVYSMQEKNITYTQATENDLMQFLNLYAEIEKNTEDKSKLVVFPEKIRSNMTLNALKNKTFFVAKDTDDTIIGFTKLYKINKENLSSILQDELNFIDDKLLLNTTYKLPLKSYSDMMKLKISEYISEDALKNPKDFYQGFDKNFNETCSYFYYGGAYTKREYRNSGINSFLIKTGFDDLLSSCNSTSYALVYGQVEKNNMQTGMIKAFAYCMAQHYKLNLKQEISLVHLQHSACKPELIIDEDGSLRPIFLKENEGRGNIIVFNSKNNSEE